MRWCGSELRQTMAASARNAAMSSSEPVRRENLVIHARQKILLEAADGFRRARHRLADAAGIEPHQRAVAFLDFDDSVLDWHSGPMITQRGRGTISFPAQIVSRVHLTSSTGARPSGRFTVRVEVKETIDLRADDVEAASTPRSTTICIWRNSQDAHLFLLILVLVLGIP